MDDTFNIIHLKEEVPERRFNNTPLRDLSNSTLLSSPISSYNITPSEDAKDLFVSHRQTYAKRFKVTKEHLEIEREEHRDLRIKSARLQADRAQENDSLRSNYAALYEDLSAQVKRLQDAEAARCREEAIVLDWETRSRIAQGLNDLWVWNDEGFTYLPYILAIWALKNDLEPTPSLLQDLVPQVVTHMKSKAAKLSKKGLDDIVEAIWDLIPDVDRNTMIKMFLSTQSHPCATIAHPLPSMSIGKGVVESDSRLSIQEKVRACEIIETGFNMSSCRLFSV